MSSKSSNKTYTKLEFGRQYLRSKLNTSSKKSLREHGIEYTADGLRLADADTLVKTSGKDLARLIKGIIGLMEKDTKKFEDAVDEINDAETLMLIAYKKLMAVEKRCPIADGYPLKEVIISLDSARLALVLVKDRYSAKI